MLNVKTRPLLTKICGCVIRMFVFGKERSVKEIENDGYQDTSGRQCGDIDQ